MDTIISLSFFGALIALGAYIDRLADRARSSRVKAVPRLVMRPVALICGDCGGLGEIATQTALTRVGTCDRCGSRNWELASRRPTRRAVTSC
jgi:hypothetical protein